MRSIYLTNVKLAPILHWQNDGKKKLIEGKAFLDKLKKEEEDCKRKSEQNRIKTKIFNFIMFSVFLY